MSVESRVATPLVIASLTIFAPVVQGDEIRTIDGTGNNLINPSLNATAGIDLKRRMPDDYDDHFSQMPYRGNPRDISNKVAAQSEDIFAPGRRSDYLWLWGQFLDHDIDLTEATTESADIPIPAGDPQFDPLNTGTKVMPFDRSVYNPASGITDPRQQSNGITGWIDASNVYGSDPTTAAELRTLDGTGRLKTSPGKLLPFDPLDPGFFFAGDIRVNEQITLTAMHTLFMREHNRLAARIVRKNPGLAGQGGEIYQQARRLVGAQIQAITYNEFIPALLGQHALRRYRGYKPNADPRIMNEFSTAAFRLGHSLLSPLLLRLDRHGEEIPAGHVELRDAFFAPELIIDDGIEPLLRGLAAQRCQAVDVFIIDEVRNFLFGPPGAGGLDLASLNIQRGRDHGLPTYNEARVAMGLTPAGSFADVSSDRLIQGRLSAAYATVDDVDLWVGGLAEDPVRPALVGELLFTILTEQFEALRDGDRFWYQISLSPAELRMVERTSLSDLIVRNTRIRRGELQPQVFFVPREQHGRKTHRGRDSHRSNKSRRFARPGDRDKRLRRLRDL